MYFAQNEDKEEECPIEYLRFLNGCYFFGSHASYDEALEICKRTEGTLANVGPKNNKWIFDHVKMRGGTDSWIGSYYQGERTVRKKGPMSCPLMRGGGPVKFSGLSCNSAYPFICQKNLKEIPTVAPENRPSRKFGDFEEVEEDVLIVDFETTTTDPEELQEGSGNALVGAMVCILALIVIAILIRCYFRQSARKEALKEEEEKKKKAESMEAGNEKKSGDGEKKEQTVKSISSVSLSSQLNPPKLPPKIPSRKSESNITNYKDTSLPGRKSQSSYKKSRHDDGFGFENEESRRRRISISYRNRRLPSPPTTRHSSAVRPRDHSHLNENPSQRHQQRGSRSRGRSQSTRRRESPQRSARNDRQRSRYRSSSRRRRSPSPVESRDAKINTHRRSRSQRRHVNRSPSRRVQSRGRSYDHRRSTRSRARFRSSSLDSSGYETRSRDVTPGRRSDMTSSHAQSFDKFSQAPSSFWNSTSQTTVGTKTTVAPFGSEFTAETFDNQTTSRSRRSLATTEATFEDQRYGSDTSDSSQSTESTVRESMKYPPPTITTATSRSHHKNWPTSHSPPPPQYRPHPQQHQSFRRRRRSQTPPPHREPLRHRHHQPPSYDFVTSFHAHPNSFVEPDDLIPMTSYPYDRMQYPPQMKYGEISDDEEDSDDLSSLTNIIAQPLSCGAPQQLIGQHGPIRIQRQIYEMHSDHPDGEEEGSEEEVEEQTNQDEEEDQPVYESIDEVADRRTFDVPPPSDLEYNYKYDDNEEMGSGHLTPTTFHQNLPPLPYEFR